MYAIASYCLHQFIHSICSCIKIRFDPKHAWSEKSSLSFWCIYFNVSIPYDFKSYYLVKHLQEMSVVLSLKIFEFNFGLKGIREANKCHSAWTLRSKPIQLHKIYKYTSNYIYHEICIIKIEIKEISNTNKMSLI